MSAYCTERGALKFVFNRLNAPTVQLRWCS
jgi:hypothetical protein